MSQSFEFHPIAGLFPLLGESELQAMADDIRDHGLREAIWLFEGKVLDGRNRYLACEIAGVEMDTYEDKEFIKPEAIRYGVEPSGQIYFRFLNLPYSRH